MDGTENQKDSSGATQDSSGGEKGTSEKPQTFTSEQMAESNTKAVSDALSKAGRTDTDLTKKAEAVQASQERLTQAQKARDEAEIEDNRDNPDMLKAIKARQNETAASAKLATLEQELRELKERNTEGEKNRTQLTQESNTREIAARLTVDPQLLAKLATLTDGSKEAIEAEAQTLPKTGEAKKLFVDSGRTLGGENWRDLSPKDKINKGLGKS